MTDTRSPPPAVDLPAVASHVLGLCKGQGVHVRPDGYLDIEQFLEAGGKHFVDLQRDFEVKGRLSGVLTQVASRVGLPPWVTSIDWSAHGLIETNAKIKHHLFRGFIHPLGALVIASNWFEPTIASSVALQYYRYEGGDRSLVKDIAKRADQVDGGTTMITMTTSTARVGRARLVQDHLSSCVKQAASVTNLQGQLATKPQKSDCAPMTLMPPEHTPEHRRLRPSRRGSQARII
jgi:hypothetical protein